MLREQSTRTVSKINFKKLKKLKKNIVNTFVEGISADGRVARRSNVTKSRSNFVVAALLPVTWDILIHYPVYVKVKSTRGGYFYKIFGSPSLTSRYVKVKYEIFGKVFKRFFVETLSRLLILISAEIWEKKKIHLCEKKKAHDSTKQFFVILTNRCYFRVG